ncbi:high mobility group nucleosome-binding domain-containing protein 5 isoform X2 [Amia ocellicauda]|uniref:high mobility group nucleosome-binding domain-containing protein 5 isoform X2 n=1 Tax=Amia ocellicauda TaxID=2972642 RepID=UPI003463D1A9
MYKKYEHSWGGESEEDDCSLSSSFWSDKSSDEERECFEEDSSLKEDVADPAGQDATEHKNNAGELDCRRSLEWTSAEGGDEGDSVSAGTPVSLLTSGYGTLVHGSVRDDLEDEREETRDAPDLGHGAPCENGYPGDAPERGKEDADEKDNTGQYQAGDLEDPYWKGNKRGDLGSDCKEATRQTCEKQDVEDVCEKEAVGRLEERLDRLQMGPREPDLELDSEDRSILSDRSNSDAGRGSSAFQVYTSDTLRSESESDVRSRPKSFIRPQMDHPHTRNLKKTDPVSKYFQYKQDWENFKAPGERERKGLRWGIREQMLYKSQLPPVSILLSIKYHPCSPTAILACTHHTSCSRVTFLLHRSHSVSTSPTRMWSQQRRNDWP